MLFSWPIISILLFINLSFERAIIWSIILPFMILPVGSGVDLPILPILDKTTIPNITLIILSIIFSNQIFSIFPKDKITFILFLIILLIPFFTAITNSDPIIFPLGYIPEMTIKSTINAFIITFVTVAPFIVGRNFLYSPISHQIFLEIIVYATLIYSILMIVEIRLSPQLHQWVYGYFPHTFLQQIRQGGFRPVVFMGHGLTVAFFTMLATFSALMLWKGNNKNYYLAKSIYLLIVLIFCKTLSAILYIIVLIPIAIIKKKRLQLFIAICMVSFSVLYPAVRGMKLLPIDYMVDIAYSYDAERGQSLEFRFDHEERLLSRAAERPFFGWGSWGRNHVHDEITGESVSVTDGYWIIVIGVSGWIGYIATFGLLAWPVFIIIFKVEKNHVKNSTIALCLIIGINMIDLLPNASIWPLTWLVVGSLVGYLENYNIEKNNIQNTTEKKIDNHIENDRTLM